MAPRSTVFVNGYGLLPQLGVIRHGLFVYRLLAAVYFLKEFLGSRYFRVAL